MQENTEVANKLVIGRKRDGRCQYDPQAKQQLVQQCLKPGVSVSRIAMLHGVNANLLRVWISKHQRTAISVQQSAHSDQLKLKSAFIPVRVESAAPRLQSTDLVRPVQASRAIATAPNLRLHVHMPNGVNLEIDVAGPDALMPVMQMLSALPCSN